MGFFTVDCFRGFIIHLDCLLLVVYESLNKGYCMSPSFFSIRSFYFEGSISQNFGSVAWNSGDIVHGPSFIDKETKDQGNSLAYVKFHCRHL